jgi:hypothetical protein
VNFHAHKYPFMVIMEILMEQQTTPPEPQRQADLDREALREKLYDEYRTGLDKVGPAWEGRNKGAYE